MKTKQTIICALAGSTMLVLFLAVVLFGSSEDEMTFQFLAKYEPTDHKPPSSQGFWGEGLKYKFEADYDTFTKAAKSELSAKGFEDVTEANGMDHIGLLYWRGYIEHVQVRITYSVQRKDPNDKKPIYSWIHVEMRRYNPDNIKTYSKGLYWECLRWFRNWGKP